MPSFCKSDNVMHVPFRPLRQAARAGATAEAAKSAEQIARLEGEAREASERAETAETALETRTQQLAVLEAQLTTLSSDHEWALEKLKVSRPVFRFPLL